MSNRAFWPGVALAFVGVSATASAQAADCALRLVTQVDTATDSYGGMFIPVTIAGKEKYLMVDSGGAFHMLKRGVVAELGLETRISSTMSFLDMLGNRTSTVAQAPGLSIGRLRAPAMEFVVVPEDSLLGGGEVSGVFSTNLLWRSYDMELDFPGHKFGLFEQQHCAGQVVYWPAAAVAVVSMRLNGAGQILIPATVDGRTLNALIDTGSSDTLMYTRIAEGFGVRPNAGATDAGTLGNTGRTQIYTHRFGSLSIEGITVQNPMMTLVPDMNRYETSQGRAKDSFLESRHDRDHEDMLIGMSILRHLHIFVAFKEQKLYITAGGAQAAAPAQPAAATTEPAQPSGSPAH